jgi:cytochrome c
MKKLVLILAVASVTSLFAAEGAEIFKKCASCHGEKAEKSALGKSQITQGWEVAKITAALKGYKDGTYGGAMKGVMKGQVAALSDADIDAVANYIHGLK